MPRNLRGCSSPHRGGRQVRSPADCCSHPPAAASRAGLAKSPWLRLAAALQGAAPAPKPCAQIRTKFANSPSSAGHISHMHQLEGSVQENVPHCDLVSTSPPSNLLPFAVPLLWLLVAGLQAQTLGLGLSAHLVQSEPDLLAHLGKDSRRACCCCWRERSSADLHEE